MKAIFCLVSRQTMANVLPVLMYKQETAILFAQPEERKSADNLEKLFKSKSIKVIRLDNLDAYNYLHFKEKIEEYTNKFDDNIALNLTVGAKLMVLAAYEVFAKENFIIIYCDTEHKNLIAIYPEYKIEKINAKLTIDDYLFSYGYKIIEKKDEN